MKTLIILALSMVAFKANGQILSIWKGNCSGHEHEWHYPSNWSTNEVPDEFSDVVIPLDVSAKTKYPVISQTTVEINSLHMWPGTVLTLQKAKLEIVDTGKSVFRRHQVIGNGTVNYKGQEEVPVYLANSKPDQN